jgi:hypothetical protein
MYGMDCDAAHTLGRTVIHILETRARVSGGLARSYKELFDLACRKADEIAPLNVSKKAHEKAQALGLGDLRASCWFCPGMRTNRDGRKRLFAWEHFKPVADIKREIVALQPTLTIEQVSAILVTTKIVWVLRDEAIALGDRSRPDPEAVYRDAGVVLLYAWEDCVPVACARHLRHSTNCRKHL